MGEPTSKIRNKEISEMLDYSFAQYEIKDLLKGKNSFGKYRIDGGDKEFVNVILSEGANALIRKGENIGTVTYDVKTYGLKAPIKKGDSIGTLNIKENGKVIKKIKLTVDRDVFKIHFWQLLFRNIKDMIVGNISVY